MIIYMILFLSILIGCCGLMLDLGMMETTKLKMQNAADAAALGAAYSYQSGDSLTAGGLADAQLNGFTSGAENVTVTISNPPARGAYQGNSSAIQAIITQPFTPTFIPALFTVAAQATAYLPPVPCVYLLSQYSTQISLNDISGAITGNCPFYVGLSYRLNGGGSSGNQFLLHGDSANSSGSVTPTPIHSPTMGDPLAYVPQPAFQSCTYTNRSVTGPATLQPGTYCGGLNIKTTGTVVLRPGVYIITGALTINGPTLTGAGVMFFMTQGGGSTYGLCSITNVTATLSAPTTGAWQGILFFSDRRMPTGRTELSLANWGPSSKVDGILYLVGQEFLASNLPLQGKKYLGFVADYISLQNTGLVTSADYSSLAKGNPFHAVGAGLVE